MSKDIKRVTAEQRAAETTKVAREIVDAEAKARDAKTVKLKAARLKQEAENAPPQPPPRAGQRKVKR